MIVRFKCGCFLMSVHHITLTHPNQKSTLIPDQKSETKGIYLYDVDVSFEVVERSALSCCTMHDAPYRQYADIENLLEVSKIEQ